jgi:hypothetical protein
VPYQYALLEIHCFYLKFKTHLLLTSLGKKSDYLLLELSSVSHNIHLGFLVSQMALQMLGQQCLYVKRRRKHSKF